MSALSPKARTALDSICDTFAPGGDGTPVRHRARGARGVARARGAQPARGGAQAGVAAARPVGHAPAVRNRRRRRQALQLAGAGRARARAALLGRQPDGPAPRRLPGAAQGRAARLLRNGRRQRRPQSGLGRHRLSGPARAARLTSAAGDRAAGAERPRHARLRRGGGGLGRRRRDGRGRARAGGARRAGGGGRPLLHREGLRRRRAVGLRPALPQRRRHGQRGRQRGPAGCAGPGRHHARELHLLVPHARTACARSGPASTASSAVAGARLRPEPRRGLGAHRRERRAQRAQPARRDDPRRARQARLGVGGDAAQRARLHRGGLPPLPLRLPARRQAVHAQDLAQGRPRGRRAGAGADARRARDHDRRPGHRHRGAHCRRTPGHGARRARW